jgi:hypothetical protein
MRLPVENKMKEAKLRNLNSENVMKIVMRFEKCCLASHLNIEMWVQVPSLAPKTQHREKVVNDTFPVLFCTVSAILLYFGDISDVL